MYIVIFCDLWYCDGSNVFWRAEIFLDKSQIVCQGKLFQIPQRTIFWHETWKVTKHDIMHRNDINMSYLSCILSYFVIYGIMIGAKFSGEQQFNLTNLRLFVKENYLRSRREQYSDTKHEKSLNSMFCLENDTNPRYYCVYWHNLLFVVLWWEQNFLQSCNLFWQVSYCLSRKIIWDPTEHLVLTRNMKNHKYTIYVSGMA